MKVMKVMKEKKYIGRAIIILLAVIVVSVIGVKVTDSIKTRKLAEQLVEEIVDEKESRICRGGIPDIKIEAKEYKQAQFENEVEGPVFKTDRYSYYYNLDLYSDEIAEIYKTKIAKQEQDDLIDMMGEIYDHAYQCTRRDTYDWKMIPFKGDYINVYFKYGYPHHTVFIETSTGDRYGYSETRFVDHIYSLYINDEKVYERIEEPPVIPANPKAPEFNSNKNDSDDIYYGGSYDPYDVDEYDNPDDFADEWAEEFAGDYGGNYDDGYDDAYEYWEDVH